MIAVVAAEFIGGVETCKIPDTLDQFRFGARTEGPVVLNIPEVGGYDDRRCLHLEET